jgi:hypothetical protein
MKLIALLMKKQNINKIIILNLLINYLINVFLMEMRAAIAKNVNGKKK